MKIFAYGTLLRAGGNREVLATLGAVFVTEARTRDAWTLVDLGPYPGLLPRDADRAHPTTVVHGEVWELPEHAVARLDAFEGCPELYTREAIALAGLEDAFTYVLACEVPAEARVIEGGHYAQR